MSASTVAASRSRELELGAVITSELVAGQMITLRVLDLRQVPELFVNARLSSGIAWASCTVLSSLERFPRKAG